MVMELRIHVIHFLCFLSIAFTMKYNLKNRFVHHHQQITSGISKIKLYSNNQNHNKDIIKSYLLPKPPENSIGNFFEKDNSFIQCYMMEVGIIDEIQYGVGFPLDLPVMLTYFEDAELKPVKDDYPDYDQLLDHVASQLDHNDLQLYRTPVVLTLQGEFEDENMNQIYPGGGMVMDDTGEDDEDEDKEYEDEDDYEDEQELTLEQLLEMEENENLVDDEEVFDDEEVDTEDIEKNNDNNIEDEDMNSFLHSSPAGNIAKFDDVPDFDIIKSSNADLSSIPSEAFISEEDTLSLRKAHRKADRIIAYADDMSLIGSFNFKKRNYHLVRLLEPIFVVGKRMEDIKGYFFQLLEDSESVRIMPTLERLILETVNKPNTNTRREYDSNTGSKNIDKSNIGTTTSSSNSNSLKKSRRRWTSRISKNENSI